MPPRAHLAPLGNFRCTSAIQTHNLKVIGSNPIPQPNFDSYINVLARLWQLVPGPADDAMIGRSFIERDRERTPAILALDGEERAFAGANVGDAIVREIAITRHALLVEPTRRFGDA
jgi:hypothetical protein